MRSYIRLGFVLIVLFALYFLFDRFIGGNYWNSSIGPMNTVAFWLLNMVWFVPVIQYSRKEIGGIQMLIEIFIISMITDIPRRMTGIPSKTLALPILVGESYKTVIPLLTIMVYYHFFRKEFPLAPEVAEGEESEEFD